MSVTLRAGFDQIGLQLMMDGIRLLKLNVGKFGLEAYAVQLESRNLKQQPLKTFSYFSFG